MPISEATRADREAQAREATITMLVDRLPDLEREPNLTSARVWELIGAPFSALGRNDFHRLLLELDGAWIVDAGLILRVGREERPSRRSVALRSPARWAWQRETLQAWRALGRRHPERIAYTSAHARVRAARGPASGHSCVDCGDPALEWSFEPGGAGEAWTRAGVYELQVGFVGDSEAALAWSGRVEDYAPRCRPCHLQHDDDFSWEDLLPAGPPRYDHPVAPSALPPLDAPAWVHAIAASGEDGVEREAMLLDRQRWEWSEGDRRAALLTHRERMTRRGVA